MKRVSWCVVGAVLAVGVGCGGNNQTRDAGAAGGSAFTGGGSSGVGGGFSGTGGGSATAGGRTGGGSAGGASAGGSSAGGSAEGDGGIVEFDGGGLMGGETCVDAVPVMGNAIVITSTTAGLGSDYAFADMDRCVGVLAGSSAPDIVYSVQVQDGEAITAAVTTPMWDAVINLIAAPADNCGDSVDGGVAGSVVCLAGADIATRGTDVAQWLNDTGSTQTVFVVIDGYRNTQEGDFSLDIRVGRPPAGDSCASPIALTFTNGAVSLPVETLNGFTSDLPTMASTSNPGCTFGPGADRVYSLSIPPGLRLTARAVSSQDIALSTIDDASFCGGSPVQCSATVNTASSGAMQTEVLTLDNSGTMPRPVLLFVDSLAGASVFSLDLTLAAPPVGDSCATAVPVNVADAGVSLAAESLTGFASDFEFTGSMGCEFTSGPDRVYSFTIPPGQRFTARANSMQNLTLNVVDTVAACTTAPVQCSASVDDAFSGMNQTEVLTLDNTGTMPRQGLLVVDSSAGAASFSLDLSVGPVPAGDTCATAVAVTVAGDAGVSLPSESLNGFVSDFRFTTGCEFGTGPDRVYQATVPANQRLLVRATSADNLALSAIDSLPQCTAMSPVCSTGADDVFSGAMQVETLAVDNPTAMPRPVLIVVDSFGVPGSSFSLEFSSGPVPPGDSCSAPTTLALVDGGVSAAGEQLMGFANDFSGSTNATDCIFASGTDRVYQVAVPANQRVTVTGSSLADLALNLVQDVAACRMSPLVCVASADSGGSSTTTPVVETLRYDNTSGAPRSFVVVVDTFGSTSSASYDLDVQVSPMPYTVAMSSGPCDTLTTPTSVLTDTTTPAIGDDVVSSTFALPFAFRHFGTQVTHYSVSSNGFLQLFTSSAGVGDAASSNQSIPSMGDPEGIVAPFWDDLDLISPTTTKVVSAVFGTGTTRHLTVQWQDTRPIGITGASLTFQARLYETTNVIELHACTLTAGTDPFDVDYERGLDATVGIESTDGADGMQHSYNTASLVAGQVIRYTP